MVNIGIYVLGCRDEALGPEQILSSLSLVLSVSQSQQYGHHYFSISEPISSVSNAFPQVSPWLPLTAPRPRLTLRGVLERLLSQPLFLEILCLPCLSCPCSFPFVVLVGPDIASRSFFVSSLQNVSSMQAEACLTLLYPHPSASNRLQVPVGD